MGLIINWNMVLLRDGSQRVVRKHLEELTSGRDNPSLAPLAFLAVGCLAGETFASKLAPKSIEFFESEECRHYIPYFSIGRVAPEF